MATELPQPGVEVVQEFQSASPTIVTPTLVPCNVAPFFEVIEALASDGTVNDDAKLATLYEQLEQTVLQSAFPSPRGNIDEVDVQEDDVRCFFEFGGTLQELSRESAHLKSYIDDDVATQPSVTGTTTEASTTGGFDVDGRTLILHLDSHTALPPTAGSLPTADNITITFAASTPGGRLTLAEVIAQVNAIVPNLASEDADKLKLTSTSYGAGASVVVRATGSANSGTDRLGFNAASDNIAVGSGFYAIDDSDGDMTSPRLKVYEGNAQGTLAAMGAGVITAPNFNNDNVEVGDNVVADGIAIGQIALVESDQLTMEVEQNIISHDNPFAPRRVRVQANNLTYPQTASEAAKITGTVAVADAAPAWVVAPNAFVGPIGASESIDVNVTVAGVAQATQTVSSGAGWANLAAVVAGINGTADIDFEAYESNDVGDEVTAGLGTHLGLRTLATNTGSGAALTVIATTIPQDGANAWDLMGFDYPFASFGDIGENQRYLPGSWAVKTPIDSWVTVGARTSGQTIIYTPTVGGVAKGAETITWSAAHAGDAAGLAAAIADWNSQALYTLAYESNSSGVATSGGGYFSFRTRGENFGVNAKVQVTGGTDVTLFATDGTPITGTATDLNGKNFKWLLDINPKVYTVTFVTDEDDGSVSLAQVLSKINEETPNIAAASSDSPPFLEIESNKVGESSLVTIGTGTGNSILGFTDNAVSTNQDGRPDPDMAIDTSGNLVIQSQILRDGLTGTPYNPGFAPVVVAYKALRIDLSPDADNPALLVVDDITTLQEAADPISTDNPGALMTYLSLLNAPTVTVAAIGVPEVSADAPDGTPLGYAKCAEFLENEEVYALATASQLSTVHQTFMTHVVAMSEADQKGERIYFFNPEIPDRDNSTLVGSGTDANTTATAGECTIEVNIAPALIAAGIDPNTDINPATGAIENEVYLDLGTDDKYYLVKAVDNGTTLTLRTSFESGDGNDDAFYTEDDFPTTLISDDWSVFIRGEELLITGTTRPDRNAIAETIQTAAAAVGSRRAYRVHPDQVGINVSGLEQLVEGYYATACVVGMVGQLPPQQGFTNYPMTGLTRVVGSSDQFTQRQLNVMAAGGVYILVQEAQGAPITCRHQLSTDLTSIETRELSITKVVDYTAKFMRAGLRSFIGRSNITQGFLDNLSTIVQGQLNFLVESGVLIGADINNLIQDADNPDTVLVDVTLDVPFPCNYIRLTLII
jgi:hypothetical protein